MPKKNRLLFIAVLEFFTGFFFWPAFLMAIFFLIVYLLIDILEKITIEEKAEKKPSHCANCKSRRYLVFPQRSKMKFSRAGFVSHKVTLYECQDCKDKWHTYEADEYSV